MAVSSAEFDKYVGIDWSGQEKNYKGIAVAYCGPDGIVQPVLPPDKHWRRAAVAEWLSACAAKGERLLIGLDFGFSLPWEDGVGYLDGRIAEDRMFDLWEIIYSASRFPADDFGGGAIVDPRFQPSYWVSGPKPDHWQDGKSKRRNTEFAAAAEGLGRPESLFKLIGAKQVGKASLAGMLTLRRLRHLMGDRLAIWPAEPPAVGQSIAVEVFPTLFRKQANGNVNKIRGKAELDHALAHFGCRLEWNERLRYSDDLGDAIITAAGLLRLAGRASAWNPAGMTPDIARREGWIFGVGA